MIEVTQVLHLCGFKNGLTARQIAFWLNMKPSSNFYAILRHAQSIGWLKGVEVPYRKQVVKTLWFATPVGERMASQHLYKPMFPVDPKSLQLSERIERGVEDELSF
jgi:hypothetical protein